MGKTYVFEGKTTNEAIEKGLKELKVSKSKVDIKILEQEDKRSFFSILTPRVVKVEMTIRENAKQEENREKKSEHHEHHEHHEKSTVKKAEMPEISREEAIKNIDNFLKDFLSKMPTKDLEYTINENDGIVDIDIKGADTGYLIGYRGEVLNSIQNVITNIASKNTKEKIKVSLNIGGYKEKREKDLQNLATKIAASVVKTGKSITLEPMSAYERKIIHTKLQENDKVTTHSVGEEPYRKIVVALKK